jgi:hypothetical protein
MVNRLRNWLTNISVVAYRKDMPRPSIESDGSLVYEDTEGWLNMGICPTPVTKWQTFRYHIGHGLTMQFPLWKVLVWSLVALTYPDDHVIDAIEGEI